MGRVMSSQFNVRFTNKQEQLLDAMTVEIGTTTADVLKKAMSLLTVVLRENKNGNRIVVVKQGKIIKEIVGIVD